MKPTGRTRGFTLVEMAVTLLIFGLVLAFSVPALKSVSQTHQLHGSAENLAAQLRLARERAIATGQTQTMHFTTNYPPGSTWDYHLHNGGVIGPGWDLPFGVSYFSVTVNPTFQKDGSASSSGIVVLQNTHGERDTVTLQLSGLVLCQ